MTTQMSAPAPSHFAAESHRGFLSATAITAVAAAGANLAIWALTQALVDVPDRFLPLQAGSVLSLTIIGVLLAAGFLRVLAARSSRPAETFRRIVPVALAVSLIPDLLIWTSGAYEGAAVAETVLPLMAMHVAAAAAAWLLLPSALPRRSR